MKKKYALPVWTSLLILTMVFVFPKAGWAPNVSDKITGAQKAQDWLFALFELIGIALTYFNIKLALKSCENVTRMTAIGFNGFFYLLWWIVSFLYHLTTGGHNYFFSHIIIYFPAGNWVLLLFWLIMKTKKNNPACRRMVNLPGIQLGIFSFVAAALAPVLYFPFHLIAMFF